jgi:prepilin-type N-terminal cleavage/methylation domain-containing protein
LRLARRIARCRSGFTMIELLAAMTILTIVAAPLLGVLTASVASQKRSRERTLAEQTVMSQIETIRSLPYSSVGVPSGNPSGTLTASQAIDKPGLHATLATSVAYVNDPVPSGYVTDADYKKVTLTLTRKSDGKQLAKETTYVAPPGKGAWSGPNQAIIKAQVTDYATNQPVQGATLSLATGPSAPRSDTTDASGSVIFPDLTPNPTSGSTQYYDLSVSAPGYTTLSTDASPNGPSHQQLSAGQTFNTTIRIYKAATITVNVQKSGTTYTGSTSVVVSSSRGSQTFTATGGTLTVTTVNGEAVVPGLLYTVSAYDSSNDYAAPVTKTVPNNYPTDLTSTFTANMSPPVAVTVNVKYGGVNQNGATVTFKSGPLNLNLSGTTNSSGNVTFNVPVGSGYTSTATSGTHTGSWSGSVSGATTINETVT